MSSPASALRGFFKPGRRRYVDLHGIHPKPQTLAGRMPEVRNAEGLSRHQV